ncbi:MAG: Sapep family Mn(2+)-dependent dipeptidase [Clostridiales bacterium]|nr:Sapep family Mn(2+)-dependent dipeptidase [Clostridiales bacterium]
MREKIETFVKCNMDDMLADISKLIAIRSVRGESEPGMPFGRGPAEAMACAEAIAIRHGFKVKHFDGYAMEINLNDGPDELGILCHLDVVHEGSGWTSPPFQADIREGRIYGRGASDNKGPAVAALYALKCVRDSGIPLSKNTRLILGADEECGSSDLKEYFKRQSAPPYSFSPDAAFPVYNIEKGRYSPSFFAEFEESESLPRIIEVEGGRAVNVVPDEAVALTEGLEKKALLELAQAFENKAGVDFELDEADGKIRICAKGLSTHASYPEDGKNALTALIGLLASAPFAECEGFRRLKSVNALFPHGDYLGEALGIRMEDEISGPLTCNLGMFKYSPSGLSGAFDARCPVCADESAVQTAAGAFLEKGLKLSSDSMLAAHYVPEELPFIQTLLQAYEAFSGQKGECVSMGGGTYVHGIKNSVAFGPSFPDTDTYAHAADECAVIAELEACVKIFAQVIIDMCG